jgi:hypothetical protein
MAICNRSKLRRKLNFLAAFCLALSLAAWSQAQPDNSPFVSFVFDLPGSIPGHYGITVFSDGHASYVSDGKLSKDAQSDQPYTSDFTISPASVNKVFDLAKQAHYFQGNLDSKKKNLANTGDKTLMYKDAHKDTIQSYNYSTTPGVQDLTTWFENLSATLEFGHRLEYDYRYEKLALDEDTKAMEDAAGRGGLVEVNAIAPTLQKIANDQSVVNVARARALRLLEHHEASGN